jgi:uncharacterized membrane protein
MTLAQSLLLYPLMAVVFFALDIVWLGVIAKGFYARGLAHLMSSTVNWAAAFVFYAIFLVGVEVFVVLPGVEHGSVARTALLGAFFGFVAYATYDLTNWATLRDWPAAVAMVDMAWGAALTGTVSLAGHLIARRLAG